METKPGSMFLGWRSAILVLLLMTVVAAPAMAAGLANTAWPKFQHDLKNTGQSEFNGPQTNTLKWTFTTVGAITHTSPVIGGDGTIYIAGEKGNSYVYAINPDGSEKWKYYIYSTRSSPAVGSDGTVYIGTTSEGFLAINPDGTRKWQFKPSNFFKPSPSIISDGTIYLANEGGTVYAINPDGTEKWNYPTGGALYYGVPAIGDDGTIYIGNSNNFFALNPDGTKKWEYSGGTIGSASIATDGTIYYASGSQVIALNSDGSLKWAYMAGGAFGATTGGTNSPVIASDGTIIIGNYVDKYLYAINPDGTLKWKYLAPNVFWDSPTIGKDGTIYVGNKDKNIYAINPDGTLKWSYLTGNVVYSIPTIAADSTLYVTSYDGKLYSFRDPVLPPVADFTATPRTGPAPLDVQFTDASTSSEKLTYAWDFENDGVVDSTEQSPLFTYANPGTFDVSLTVTNTAGPDTMVKEAYITADKPIGAPEFPTMALPAVLVIGMLGTVLFIRRTKEN